MHCGMDSTGIWLHISQVFTIRRPIIANKKLAVLDQFGMCSYLTFWHVNLASVIKLQPPCDKQIEVSIASLDLLACHSGPWVGCLAFHPLMQGLLSHMMYWKHTHKLTRWPHEWPIPNAESKAPPFTLLIMFPELNSPYCPSFRMLLYIWDWLLFSPDGHMLQDVHTHTADKCSVLYLKHGMYDCLVKCEGVLLHQVDRLG